jgi:hypothetical protein
MRTPPLLDKKKSGIQNTRSKLKTVKDSLFGFRNGAATSIASSIRSPYSFDMALEDGMSSQFSELSRVAHRLNNDLGIILAECDILEGMVSGSPATLRRLQAIRAAAQRVADRIASYANRPSKKPPD